MSVTIIVCTTIVVVFLAVCTSEPIRFKPCDGAPNNIKEVDISPCPSQPCEFKHGTNASVKVTFTAVAKASNLTSHIYGILEKVPVPFPMPNPDACVQSGLKCPLEANQEYSYTQYLDVKPSYPNIRLVVQWDVTYSPNKYQFCFVFPMTING